MYTRKTVLGKEHGVGVTNELATSLKNRSDDNLLPIERKNNTQTHKSKSLAALPCKLRFAAKHMLFSHRTSSVESSVKLERPISHDDLR
jgi:hypothetical protein